LEEHGRIFELRKRGYKRCEREHRSCFVIISNPTDFLAHSIGRRLGLGLDGISAIGRRAYVPKIGDSAWITG